MGAAQLHVDLLTKCKPDQKKSVEHGGIDVSGQQTNDVGRLVRGLYLQLFIHVQAMHRRCIVYTLLTAKQDLITQDHI